MTETPTPEKKPRRMRLTPGKVQTLAKSIQAVQRALKDRPVAVGEHAQHWLNSFVAQDIIGDLKTAALVATADEK